MPQLDVITYHYVRDLPRTRFPQIKGMLLAKFEEQVQSLAERYEMATLESALAFLQGSYQPSRDLCLLTFDDGLKEHFTEVTPILARRGIQGIFFLVSSCAEERCVAPVHMNHFLMAELDFPAYRSAFFNQLTQLSPTALDSVCIVPAVATRTYPWDTAEIASFKYLFNFLLDPALSARVVELLFEKYLGDQQSFSDSLYLSWEDARQMQSAGMLVGGHSHQHRPLATLSDDELAEDLNACRAILERNVGSQALWPFSYPYGKKESFTTGVVERLQRLGFDCSFSTETGVNAPGVDLFAIRRMDCTQVPVTRS